MGVIKSMQATDLIEKIWSEWPDLNRRPPHPQFHVQNSDKPLILNGFIATSGSIHSTITALYKSISYTLYRPLYFGNESATLARLPSFLANQLLNLFPTLNNSRVRHPVINNLQLFKSR